MDHKSIEGLKDEIHTAAQLIEVGGRYVHYKNQHTYVALGLVVLESTDEVAVRYSDVGEPHIEFVRLLSDWTATVEGRARFIPVPSVD